MTLTKARSASFQSYGSIPTSDVDYIESMEEGSSYHSHPIQSGDNFLLNQLSNRNTRVFGGVVASLALFTVMVGLFNNSSAPAAQTSNSAIIKRDSKLFGKYERMARSGRYMFAAEKPEEKEAAQAEPAKAEPAKEAAKEQPAKKEASQEEAEAKADNTKAQVEENSGNTAAAEKHENAAREHAAAANQWEKAAEKIGQKYQQKERDAIAKEQDEQNFWKKKYTDMAKKWANPDNWM